MIGVTAPRRDALVQISWPRRRPRHALTPHQTESSRRTNATLL